MRTSNGWDEMIFDNVSAESASPDLLQRYSERYGLTFSVVDRSPSILIKLPKSWDDYLNTRSSSLRYKIKRGRTEFLRLGGTYYRVEKESELHQAFTDLERLHQDRWASKGTTGAFSSNEWKTFHRKLMPLLLKRGQLRLSFLRLNDHPVAAIYNFAFDNKIHFFQSGLMPHQNKHIRPGLLLHSYCIEEAIKDGFTEYDFLKSGKSGPGYKKMWGNYSRDLLTIRIARKSNKEKMYGLVRRAVSHARAIKATLQRNVSRKI
jgi:CelD/BcsL family acetyltransferase involved in cellulose biosynthesis